MKTSSIFAMGNGFQPSKKPFKPRTTAYYIFDEDVRYPYTVNTPYFHQRNNRMGNPLIGAANAEDVERISKERVSTADTAWNIVTQFIEGADIGFDDPSVPANLYKRILNHLENHLAEMRTNISYDAPEMDDFRYMAEFATAIRHVALKYNSELDKNVSDAGINRFLFSRPTFIASRPEVRENKPVIPKSVKTMDAIERFLELSHGS